MHRSRWEPRFGGDFDDDGKQVQRTTTATS
jgi:hypothetical protein